jgi:RecG-like helicase
VIETITSTYQALLRLHNTCTMDIQSYNAVKAASHTYEYETSVASLTKHFELYYMLLAQYLHAYLHRTYQTNTPIKIKGRYDATYVLHQCFKKKLITIHEAAALHTMHEVYAMSKFIYDTDIAQEVSAAIPHYHTVLNSVLPRIAPDTIE